MSRVDLTRKLPEATQIEFKDSHVQQVPRLAYGIDDACIVVGHIPKSTFEKEVREGRGPKFFKVGRRLITTPRLLKKWLAEKEQQAE